MIEKPIAKITYYLVVVAIAVLALSNVQDSPTAYSQELHRQQNSFIAELEWNPAATLLAVGTETGVKLYTPQLQVVASIVVPFAQGLAWSPNGEKLAIGYYDSAVSSDSRGVQIWDVATSNLDYTLPSARSDFMRLLWHPDGNHLIVSNGGKLEFWDIASAQPVNTYDNGFIVSDMDMTSDGSLLVSEASNNLVTVWDINSATILHELPVEDALTSVAVDDAGARVAANSKDVVIIWNTATEEIIASLQTSGLVQDMVWNADTLVSLSSLSDGSNEIEVWDTNTYSSAQTIQSVLIFDVALSNDGTRLAYGRSLDMLQINEISQVECDIQPLNSIELISAITAANGTPEPDTICLADNGTYTFTTGYNSYNALPPITSLDSPLNSPK